MSNGKVLYLCAGTQSSGSTLISWCFLQRCDMNGVLDADNDILAEISPALGQPYVWYKTTIGCFRLAEMVEHYEDEGWEVRPLLIVRDVRDVWASVLKKPYVSNGMTAEDPPVRLRMRRFREDWETFRRRGWPILRFESVLESPREALLSACEQLDLAWDEGMISWPKRQNQIADTRHGNPTFWNTRGGGLLDTLDQGRQKRRLPHLPADDLEWLQSEFREFNAANGYPTCLEADEAQDDASAYIIPFEATRRYKWELRRKPVRWLFALLGIRDAKLDQRFLKRTG